MVGSISNSVSPKLRLAALAMGLAVLAGCATPPPPPVVVAPPPPPPPPVQLIPARPTPPGGAAPMMALPAMGLDGNRLTINTGLTAAQTTWNLRSALNVAALNCYEPRHAGILENYKVFLTKFERPLRNTSSKILEEFRAKYGRSQGQSQFDGYMTQVYNYFALPPSLDQFCDAALTVSADSTIVAPADLDSFAARALPQLEVVFQDFFRSYENYQRNLASWTATYGADAVPGTPVPAWIRSGSLGPTPGEQVLYRETPQGEAYPPSIGTVEVMTMPAQAAPAPAPAPAPEPVVIAEMPVVDPGASEVAAGTVPAEALPATNSGIVFTSQPVVQGPPEKDE